MDRRQFLGLSAFAIFDQAGKAQQCGQITPGVVGCRVQLGVPKVILAATLQQCPEWCWAASISTIFKFFDHPLDQRKIVIQKYGELVCMPALAAAQIASDLSSTWTDDDGDDFSSTLTAAYDFQAGVLAINNVVIVNEILHGRPLLYCNTHHAMVICGVDYRPSPIGPLIDGVAVIDPWPPAPRVHPLSHPELLPAHQGGQMTFLASVNVS